LGRSFILYLEANGHAAQSNGFQFDIGAIRLEGASSSGSSSGGSSGSTDGSGSSGSSSGNGTQVPGVSLDSLSQLTSCNLCAIVTDSGRKAVAVVPAGGGSALAFSVVVDSNLVTARTLSFDLKSEFVLQGWEQVWFFVDDTPHRLNWDQYLTNIPALVSSGWTTINLPFDGSRYLMGSTAKFMLSVNANPPSGKRMYVDNVRWTP
jgi:hypothetical protein